MNRDSMLAAAGEDQVWDVAIIGGGATGLGTALESASRGYRTILLEADDFAKATSSRSTKLIHGGVRYLQSGQVGMVRESLKERERLLRNAPHLVRRQTFLIPCFSRWQQIYYLAGMKAYDFLAGSLKLKPARSVAGGELQSRLPTLDCTNVCGGVQYSDAQFDDARLALALARSCVQQGGVVMNYAPVIRLRHEAGKISGLGFRDLETGAEVEIRARTIVNATGVFYEKIAELDQPNAGHQAITTHIVPSRGTHLMLPSAVMPGDDAMLIPKTDDGRVMFAIPWNGGTILGTTDQQIEQIEEEPRPSIDEVEYLLRHAARYFSDSPKMDQIKSVFAGLRPLVSKTQRNKNTAAISREHSIIRSPTGLLSIIGGKWTTYRSMGEQVIDALKELPKSPSVTSELPLAGADAAKTASQDESLDPIASFREYDAEIQQAVSKQPSLANRLHPSYPYSQAHVVMSARHEMARTVEDVLSRRTRLLLLDAEAAQQSAPLVAQLLATELGRSKAWQGQQLRAFEKIAKGYVVR